MSRSPSPSSPGNATKPSSPVKIDSNKTVVVEELPQNKVLYWRRRDELEKQYNTLVIFVKEYLFDAQIHAKISVYINQMTEKLKVLFNAITEHNASIKLYDDKSATPDNQLERDRLYSVANSQLNQILALRTLCKDNLKYAKLVESLDLEYSFLEYKKVRFATTEFSDLRLAFFLKDRPTPSHALPVIPPCHHDPVKPT